MNHSRRTFLAASMLGGVAAAGLRSRAAQAAIKEFDPYRKVFTHSDPKHTPVITAPGSVKAGEPFDVTIQVGSVAHPMMSQHSLRWIELYASEVQIARVEFLPVMTRPKVTLTIALDQSTTLRALAMPNHSGAFAATKHVTVS